MKHLLTIAGSDCSGGAGIQADLKTFAAHGAYGMSVITAVVAENTFRVLSSLSLSGEVVTAQLAAVFADLPVHGVKIGMLPTGEVTQAVVQVLAEQRPPHVVLDPVMLAKDGHLLMDEAAYGVLVGELFPLVDVLTPNIPEAAYILGRPIDSLAEMAAAAKDIAALGPQAVLVKGGHRVGDAVDVLYDGAEVHHFSTPRIPNKTPHGTGCTYSSAVTVGLAQGLPLAQAVGQAKAYMTAAIAGSMALGKGHDVLAHFPLRVRGEQW